MDAIYGVTMDLLAELMTKDGELRAKLGDQQGRAEYDRFLATRGLDSNTAAMAHNAWHERFRADPTGRLHAQFHMLLAQGTQKAHFGDVPDMSQDKQGGITLDTYAQITVAVGKPGADANAIVAQHGLDIAGWQAANAAWTAAMSKDTSHRLTMQYGTLYQKHAGPAFQEAMFNQTAAILAEPAPTDVIDEPEEVLTPELCLQKMQSASRNERWRYARHYAHMADIGNVPNKVQAIATVVPHFIEMLERHDEQTVSDAESAIEKLWDLGVRSDDMRTSASICLNRAREKLSTLKAAFAPIQDKAVPERVFLQAKIQDYSSLVQTLQDVLGRDWHEGTPSAIPGPAPAAAAMGAYPAMGMAPKPSGGGAAKFVLIPVLLAMLGGGIWFARGMVGRSKSPSAASSAAASASAASTTRTTSAATAATAAPTAAIVAASGHAPSTPASAGKATAAKKKGK